MKESIFRKKSMERITSPEEIDDYMKVTSLSMWFVLGFVILLLSAIVLWGFVKQTELVLGTDVQVSSEVNSSDSSLDAEEGDSAHE